MHSRSEAAADEDGEGGRVNQGTERGAWTQATRSSELVYDGGLQTTKSQQAAIQMGAPQRAAAHPRTGQFKGTANPKHKATL